VDTAAGNLYPADAVLNLPAVKHSAGLARLAAVEAARGSFDDAQAAIERTTGVRVGKRQVEELAAAAARDVDAFYAARRPQPCPDRVLVLVLVPDHDAPVTARQWPGGGRYLDGRAGAAAERVTGIEPAPSAWKAEALPLSYTRGGPARRPGQGSASCELRRSGRGGAVRGARRRRRE
jgi:hypothetical protein